MLIVNLPNGTKLNFPDGMSEDDMKTAIHKNFPEYAPKGDVLVAPDLSKKVESPLLDDLTTGIKSAFAGVGNAVDTAANLTLGGVISNFRPDLADPLYKGMQERNATRNAWANPNKQEIGVPGKVVGAVATLPQQFVTSPLSPFTSGMEAINAGESLPRAMGAATIDAVGNAAGFLVGQGKTLFNTVLKNAGANAAQEAVTKWVQQQLMQTEQGKKTFDPNVADTLVAAIVGGGTAGALHQPTAKLPDTKSPVAPVQTTAAKIKAERQAKAAPVEQEPLKDTRSGQQLSKEAYTAAQREKQLALQSAFNRPDTLPNLTDRQTPIERMAQDLGAPELNLEGFGDRSGIRDMANQLIVGDQIKAAREKQTLLDQQFGEQEQRAKEEQARYQAAQDAVNNRQNALYQNPAITHDPVTAYTTALNEKLRQAKESADNAKTQAEYVAAKEHEARIAAEVEKMQKMHQMEIDDTQHVLPDTNEVIAPQYGAMKGTGRFDENGMPIRADLSMEASNLENPLQRNLWGDELGQKSLQENRSSLTQAIDKMPAGPERDAGLSLLKPPVELEVGNNPFVQNLARKLEKQRELVSRLEADVQSGKKMGTQLVRARKDLKTMQGHYEKAKQNLGKVSDKQANPFGRDTVELNSGVPLPDSVKNFFSSDKEQTTLDKMIPAMSRSLDTPEKVIERAVDQTDIPDRGMVRKGQESLQKGFLYAKEQFNNAVMNFTYNKITEAGDKISIVEKRLIDDTLLPSLRDLSTPEFTKLWSTLLEGMKEKITFTPEELSKHYGFSEKQIASFEHIQTALRESFDNINAARKAQGKGEISPYIGYLAGMAKGAYKRVVSIKGEHGVDTVVGIIGSDFRHVVDSRMKALKEAHPEYIFSEEKFSGPSAHAKQDGSALVEALGILSDQNPNVDAFAKQMQDVLSAEAESYRGAKKHTMAKKGIWGMEGDKSWRTPEQNALDGMKGQVSYIREMIRWNELSKASQEIGKVLSDPSIQEKQKNAIERSREYLQNALGTSQTSAVDLLVSRIAQKFGLAPSFAEKGANTLKNFYNTAFLALSPVFLLVNHISGATQFPAMAQYLSSKGIKLNADMGTGLSSMMEGILAANKAMMFGKFANEFDKRAWEAAKDMAVISSQLIGHSNELRKNPSYYLNKTSHFGAAHSEASPRAAVFMATARLLKENGFENDPNIFHVARDVTDMTMGVFRKEEQPTVYNHFGALAPLAGQLSTFVTNANSNLMMAARMIPRDSNVKPLMAIMVSAMLMGGITGMPGFTQMDWLTEQWSSKFGKEPTTLTNEILKLAKDSKNKGALALGIPSLTGIDIHQSLGRPNLMPPLFSAGGQMWKTGGNLIDLGGDLAARDTAGAEMDVKRALLHVMPPVIRKNAEMAWFGKEQPNGDLLMHSTTKGKSSQGTISLTPEEQTARKFGMNTVSTFKKSQEDYQRQLRDQHIQDKQQKIMTRLDEVIAKTKGPYQSGEIRNVLDKYIEAEGDPKTFVSQLTAKGLGDQTTAVQRYLIQKANSGSLSAARALQRWKENQLVDRP